MSSSTTAQGKMHPNVFSTEWIETKKKNVSTNAGRMAKVWDGEAFWKPAFAKPGL